MRRKCFWFGSGLYPCRISIRNRYGKIDITVNFYFDCFSITRYFISILRNDNRRLLSCLIYLDGFIQFVALNCNGSFSFFSTLILGDIKCKNGRLHGLGFYGSDPIFVFIRNCILKRNVGFDLYVNLSSLSIDFDF